MTTITSVQFLTPSEAGRRLGVSAQTIRRRCDAGLLAYMATPYGRLVLKSAVEAIASVEDD